MSQKSTFTWLPVTRMPDGSELRLPMHVVEGARPGPTLGLSGMIHGEEPLPSVGIIQRVLELLNPADLSGRVMAVPVCNPLAAGTRSRQTQVSGSTPADGANLNMVFFEPGHGKPKYVEPVETITWQIASVLRNEFLCHLNYQIDLHGAPDNHSVHMIEFTDDPVCTSMARAFNMPILLLDEWRPGQMWTESLRMGAKVIVAECGTGGPLYDEWVERGVRGVFNVMRVLGMLPGKVEKPPKQYLLRADVGYEHNLTILRPKEGGIILPDPAINPRASFDGQPVAGVPVLARLLNKYDLTVHQTFEAPFERILMLGAVVAPAWCFPGEFAYILADANAAEVLD